MIVSHTLLRAVCSAALIASLFTAACDAQARKRATIGQAPYEHNSLVWAVAPARNESGVSIVDVLSVSDEFANAVQNVPGLSAVPVNRTLGAMRSLNLPAIETEEQAVAVARHIGADGIIVPVVTAWDPYDPAKLGLSVALYAVSSQMKGVGFYPTDDPKRFQIATTDRVVLANWGGPGPVATFAHVFDAADFETQNEVRDYAQLHPNAKSALGWRQHTASMRLFTRFACHQTVGRLLFAEHARFASMASGEDSTKDR
jgi:hypothetical protein